MSIRKPKDQSIETLRGLALLLVLSHHAHSLSFAGDYVSQSFQWLRMPLFTAISGYLYGIRPVQPGALCGFLLAKWKRVGVPMVTCLLMMFALFVVFPQVLGMLYLSGVPKNALGLARFFFVHPQTYWFLQAILWIFLLVSAVDTFWRLTSIRNWLVMLLLSIGLLVAPFEFTGWFSLDGFQYLFAYFMLGMGFGRFNLSAKLFLWRNWIFVLAVVLFLLIQAKLLLDLPIDIEKMSPLGVVGSMVLTSAALFCRCDLVWLARLGREAFPIYLFHRIGWLVGMALIPFKSMPLGLDLIAHMSIMLVVGASLGYLFRLNPYTRLLFLGEKQTY